MSEINWPSVQDEVTQILSDLIRLDTTNPPGNETLAANYLACILRREGLQAEVVESAPGRGSVVARYRGNGKARPLLLLSHLDVVPVEADKWQHDPFGGEVVDGYLWGRGTVDCKGLTAEELTALLLLVRQGVALKRDIIFAATADEETGGQAGVAWLVANRPELLDAEWCINEGGGEAYTLAGKTLYTCQTAEKGPCGFKVIARGPAGHGSIPRADNAVILLCKAMQRLGEANLPLHATDTMVRFMNQVAAILGSGVTGDGLLQLAHDRVALANLIGDPAVANMLYAMLHNTMTPTILQAGAQLNVIPSVAEGQVDTRLVPGQTKESFHAELLTALGDLPVEIEFLDNHSLGLEAPPEGELYDAICQVMAEHAPDGIVVPFLVTGATDARHLAHTGMRIYGFMPMREDRQASPMELCHNHNERISVENLVFGTRVLYEVMRRFCAEAGDEGTSGELRELGFTHRARPVVTT